LLPETATLSQHQHHVKVAVSCNNMLPLLPKTATNCCRFWQQIVAVFGNNVAVFGNNLLPFSPTLLPGVDRPLESVRGVDSHGLKCHSVPCSE